MKALVDPTAGGRIAQLAEKAFTVAPPLYWIDAPAGIRVEDRWDGASVVPTPIPEAVPTIPRSLIERRIKPGRETTDYEQVLASLTPAKWRLWMTVQAVRCLDPEIMELLSAAIGEGRAHEVLSPASQAEISKGWA